MGNSNNNYTKKTIHKKNISLMLRNYTPNDKNLNFTKLPTSDTNMEDYFQHQTYLTKKKTTYMMSKKDNLDLKRDIAKSQDELRQRTLRILTEYGRDEKVIIEKICVCNSSVFKIYSL